MDQTKQLLYEVQKLRMIVATFALVQIIASAVLILLVAKW